MRITGLARKVLLTIAGGTTTIVMAACYGVSAAFDEIQLMFHAHDGSGTAIEGLEVQVDCATPNSTTLDATDANGDAVLFVPETADLSTCQATISDVDGADNGGEFATQTVPLAVGTFDYDVEVGP